MTIPLRTLLIAQVTVAAVGAAIVIAFIIAAGVDYRIREDQGLPPVYTPQWMVAWIEFGSATFAVAGLGLAVTGAVALIRRRAQRA